MRNKTMLAASLLAALLMPSQSPALARRTNTHLIVAGKSVKLDAYLPDLRITQVKVSGTSAIIEIMNRCKGDAPASRLRLTLYQGSTKDSPEATIYEFDVPAIPGGQKTTVTVDLAKVGGVKYTFEGKYYRFVVDPSNKIKEAIEGNNWFEKTGAPFPDAANSCEPVKAPPPNALPDFRITKVTIDGAQMFVEIINQCKGAAAASRLRLNLYSGPTKGSPGGDVLEADVPAISPGAKATVAFDLKKYGSKFATFGDKYYRLEADVSNKVKETIENNNWWEKVSRPFPDPADACSPK